MRLVVPLIVGACFAVSLTASVARADDKAECLGSYERAQTLRRQSKLRDARQELLVCTREICPKLVRADCIQWMDEVTGSLPTIIFAANDAQGRDRTDVRVFVDGVAVAEALGREVTLDPGPHKVRFDPAGARPLEQEIVVRSGEKGRLVTVSFADAPATTAPKPTGAPRTGRTDRPVPLLVPVLGGVGLAAVGVGSYLAISGTSQLGKLRDTCAPHCEPSDVDALNLRYRIAASVIALGVVAVGAAVWLWVTRPQRHDGPALAGPLLESGMGVRF